MLLHYGSSQEYPAKMALLELFRRVCKLVGILVLDLPYLGKMESFNPYGRRNLTMYLVPGLCLVARLSSSMRTEHMTLLVLRCLSLCTGRKVHDISYVLVSEITKKNMRHCDRLAILLLFFSIPCL